MEIARDDLCRKCQRTCSRFEFMARLKLKISYDLELDGCSEETSKAIELAAAQFVERYEFQLVMHLQERCPDLSVKINTEDEDDSLFP